MIKVYILAVSIIMLPLISNAQTTTDTVLNTVKEEQATATAESLSKDLNQIKDEFNAAVAGQPQEGIKAPLDVPANVFQVANLQVWILFILLLVVLVVLIKLRLSISKVAAVRQEVEKAPAKAISQTRHAEKQRTKITNIEDAKTEQKARSLVKSARPVKIKVRKIISKN